MGQPDKKTYRYTVDFINTGEMGQWFFYIYSNTTYNYKFSRRFEINIVYNCIYD